MGEKHDGISKEEKHAELKAAGKLEDYGDKQFHELSPAQVHELDERHENHHKTKVLPQSDVTVGSTSDAQTPSGEMSEAPRKGKGRK